MREELLIEDEALAKEALILSLFRGYLYLIGKVSAASTKSYLDALETVPLGAVKQAVERILSPNGPEQWRTYAPSAPDLAAYAALFDRPGPTGEGDGLISYRMGELPPPGYVPLGPIDVDFGHGRINMRGLSHAQKEAIMQNKGEPSIAIGNQRVTPKLRAMR